MAEKNENTEREDLIKRVPFIHRVTSTHYATMLDSLASFVSFG